MIRNVMALIFGVGLTNLALADTTVWYAYATQEENRQLFGLDTARREGQLAELNRLDRVLKEHPDNAAARSIRANALMQMGRLDEASRDIDELARRSPEYRMLPDNWIRYYRIKGDRIKELEGMKNLATRKVTDDTAMAFAGAIRWHRPWIAELSGNTALAKKEWQKWVDESPLQQRADYMTYQVQFYLRRGDYEDAVTVAKAAVEHHRHHQSHQSDCLTNTLTWYGFSLWVSGKRAEALATFVDAAEQPNDESFFAPGALFYRRSLAILSVRVLAANDTEKDKAAKLMSALSKSALGKRPYSLEPVVLALSGGSEMKPVADTVAKVLKQAPNLDWALWAALYLGLSGQDEARALLTLLPKDSIQKRIAEQEGNAPTTPPTNPGRE